MHRLLQVVPDQTYYFWQLYVQMLNFRELDLENYAVVLIALNDSGRPSAESIRFAQWTKASVYFYSDTRKSKEYLSSIRPNIIKQHLLEYPDHGTFLYHDQDIIFQKRPNLEELFSDQVFYVAEAAKGYLYLPYLLGFDKYIYYSMCKIADISPVRVQEMDHTCGGAQYVLKNTDASFWEKVEKDCEGIYKYCRDISQKGLKEYNPDIELPTYHIQIWTADMWALLWNIWRMDKPTAYHPDIDFSWPWEKITESKNVIHNAGITHHNSTQGGKKVYFHKDEYRNSYPFTEDMSYVSEEIVQHKYISYFKILQQQLFNNNNHNNDHNYTPCALTAQYSPITILPSVSKPTSMPSVALILCTNNKVNAGILGTVLSRLRAVQLSTAVPSELITCSWKAIPDNPASKQLITPFNDLGHLNYILQLKQALMSTTADIIIICEHDVLYANNYIDKIISSWDYNRYGISNLNYIGMNADGYQRVTERHEPFSQMSFARFYLCNLLDQKLNECIGRLEDKTWGNYGWACIEPDNKSDLVQIPFTDEYPNIHINADHHFTGHAQVCYEPSAYAQVRADWGDYHNWFTYTDPTRIQMGQPSVVYNLFELI